MNVNWIPGLDHAGISAQSVVENYLWNNFQKTKHDYGRADFLGRMNQWKDQHGSRILEQLKKLALSLSWEQQYFTLDEYHSSIVTKCFHQLFRDGLIYRADRIVNYCPFLETTLSDLEVETIKIDGQIVLDLPDGSKSPYN